MGPRGYALVTGASYGIGEEFARQLAERGWSLVVVARSQDRLAKLREELMQHYGQVDVLCVAMDLAAPGAAQELFEKTQKANVEINMLVNNAGFGAYGEFSSTGRERQLEMIDLNVRALVELSHLYLEPMKRRGVGAVVNVASIAGMVPLPYNAVYGATKAFVLSFSHALHEEARGYGVQVLAVNPGKTATNFFEVAKMDMSKDKAKPQTAAQVVREALRAMDRGKRSVTTGAANRMLMRLAHFVPRGWVAAAIGKKMRTT
jgi:short-subunit dehydrogenase